MWSIDYIAETVEEQSMETQSIDPISLDPAPSSIEIDQDKEKLSVQDSEEVKSESELKEENEKTEELDPGKREAAIKRVEELVKQMSLSHEKEG